MRLALGLGIVDIRRAPVFDPGTLALEGWWRASFSASPWVGEASGGGSSGRNLTEATNPPSAGTALNGRTPADFDGVNDRLNGAACSTFLTTATFSGWALVKVNAIDTDNTANQALNDTICGTTGTSQWSIYLRSTGPVVGMLGFDGTANNPVEATISTGAWSLVQFTKNGGTNRIRVNGGAWSSVSGGSINSLAANLSVGDLAGGFLDGDIADLALSQSLLSDAAFDSVRGYCNSRYGVSV